MRDRGKMSNIYGGQFNPFGSLPLGYNPNSQSSVISTGGLWPDCNTVWNLADPSGLVQSLPETQSGLRGLRLQYNSAFAYPNQSSANFYDNMLAQQALSTYSVQGTSNPMDMMTNMLSMMLIMKKIENMNNQKDDNHNDNKVINAKDKDIKKDIIDNDDVKDDAEITYTSLDGYSKDKFKELQGSDAAHPQKITFKDALKSTGIETSSLSDGAKKVIAKSLGYPNSNNFDNLEVATSDKYKTLLTQLGFSADRTSITKKELMDNIEKLKSGETLQEMRENDRILKEKVDKLKGLLKDSAGFDAEGIDSSVKELISDKKGTRVLFEKIKNGEIQLPKIFKALAKKDPNNSNRKIDDSIDDFGKILTTLKDAAEEHDLTDSWNDILGDVKDDDKNAMYDIIPHGWFDNQHIINGRKEALDKTFTDAAAEKGETPVQAEDDHI